MDEDNKKQSDSEDSSSQHQHVHIFGAEVNGSGSAKAGPATDETKDEWRKRREEWKSKHHEQREQWKARRQEWRHSQPHAGSLFGGLIVLLVGVLALLYTMRLASPVFWHAIIPFWPILLIFWGASLILGRHWFARFILFVLALVFLIIVILYGLVRADSPLVSSLSPTVVSAIQNSNPQY